MYNDTLLFKARIYDIHRDFFNLKTVQCEGLLAYLNDSIIPPYTFNRVSRIHSGATQRSIYVYEYITDLLNEHNSQVEDHQKLFLDTSINSEIFSKEISCSNSGYSDAWSELSRNVLDNLAYSGDIEYNYLRSEPKIAFIDSAQPAEAQQFRYGINLIDLQVMTATDGFATAIMPVSIYTDDDGQTQSIDISSVSPNGSKFIIDQTAVNRYGRINKVIEFNGTPTAAQLYSEGAARLGEISGLKQTFTASALDMFALSTDYTPLRVRNYVRVFSEPHGVNAAVEVIGFDVDIIEPAKSTYMLNGELQCISKMITNRR
jgi:hypothetical protein